MTDKKTSVQCTHCFAMSNNRLIKSLNVKMELQFDYENRQICCTAFLNIDFEKLKMTKSAKECFSYVMLILVLIVQQKLLHLCRLVWMSHNQKNDMEKILIKLIIRKY